MRKKLLDLGLALVLALGLMMGCKTIQYVPVEHTHYVTVRDSVYLRDTTIQYKVEKEYIKDYTGLLDTLSLETGMASAKAWVDTSRNTLAGEIKNKENVIDIPVQVKEKVITRDSVVYKEVPVPVEVVKEVHPKYELALWGYLVFSLIVVVLIIAHKFLPR